MPGVPRITSLSAWLIGLGGLATGFLIGLMAGLASGAASVNEARKETTRARARVVELRREITDLRQAGSRETPSVVE